MDQSEQDLKALQDFIVGNAELEKLEALLDRFNIFEAVGMERQEIRHSKFLSFLLDPKETHGLYDGFVKRLLQRAMMEAPDVSTPVTPIELSLWNLGNISVRREWQHIDIFLLDERHQLAVIIENKIGATEHGDQLARYFEAVREHYPEHKVIALYLTSSGNEPSHLEYLQVNYSAVCDVLDDLAESRASVIEPDLRILITHYTEMLRRHIVGNSEVARLSRQIYQKHQRAVDLMLEHRFAPQEAIRKVLETLIKANSDLVYTHRFTNYPAEEYIHFGIREWDVPNLQVGSSRQEANRILLFGFGNWPDRVGLFLQIRPGDDEVRRLLLEIAHAHPDIFKNPQRSLDKFTGIYNKSLLSSEFYESAVTHVERERELRKNWEEFLDNDLPRIEATLNQISWIWQ